jgi:hypothetical protein
MVFNTTFKMEFSKFSIFNSKIYFWPQNVNCSSIFLKLYYKNMNIKYVRKKLNPDIHFLHCMRKFSKSWFFAPKKVYIQTSIKQSPVLKGHIKKEIDPRYLINIPFFFLIKRLSNIEIFFWWAFYSNAYCD